MKICFASHNQDKVREIAQLVSNEINIVGLEDLGLNEEIEETGSTIEQNSKIKAHYVYSKFKLPVFADDTGLEVNALNGEPGVMSARYAGIERSNEKNISLLLRNLQGFPDKTARFKTVITLIDQGEERQFEGVVTGKIVEEPRGNNGFGYDPVFEPDGFTKTFAEMEAEEKNKLSHRARAFKKLLSYLGKINE